MEDGAASLESRVADLEAKVAALSRQLETLTNAVTRAVDAAMHVKLELEEMRARSPRATADEAV
jgi:regulator of replication initiation timing